MPCAFHAEQPFPVHKSGLGCQFAEDQDHPLVESGDEQWSRFHMPLDTPGADGARKADWDTATVAAFNDAVFDHIDAAKAAGEPADLTGVVFPGNILFRPLSRRRGRAAGRQILQGPFRRRHQFLRRGRGWGVGERREAVALECGPGEEGKTVTTDAGTVPAWVAPNDFRWADFSGARFDGSAVFSNRRFTDATNFIGATFHVAPLFHNAVLHQDTDFTGTAFLDRSGDAAPAYRTLKLAMEQLRARDEEGMFYALEMESRRRRKDTPKAMKLFSLL